MKTGWRIARGTAILGLIMAFAAPASADQRLELPAPRMEGGMPIMEALAKRQSIRAYADRPLPRETLSNLLWAAFGINRRDKEERTAPSWRGAKAIDVYVATPEALFVYEPVPHTLRHVVDGDIREHTGRQPFPATAPVVLIYVADRARMPEAPDEARVLNAHADSGFISQNVYLFAASEGLGTVVLGNVEKPALAAAMKLPLDRIVTFTQPVGFPR
jgi:nitroreductase